MQALELDVLDRLLEGCQVIGYDWRYLYVNEALAAQSRMTRDQLSGRSMLEVFPGIEETRMFAMLRRCMFERTYQRMENEFTFEDGTRGWFELRFLPVPDGVCILSLDVTETKTTAHDVNNNLSVILSYSSLLVDDLAEDDPKREDCVEIMRAGQRAAELTKKLLPRPPRRC
jgi:PAS domain S-box-containing protein